MSPEEKAAARETAVQGLIARGYTRERAEAVLGMVSKALFGPGGTFAPPSEAGDQDA